MNCSSPYLVHWHLRKMAGTVVRDALSQLMAIEGPLRRKAMDEHVLFVDDTTAGAVAMLHRGAT